MLAGGAPARAAAVGAAAALAARGAYAGLRRYPPAGEKTWTRTNHRGEHVTLLEGPAVAAGAVAAQVTAAAVSARLSGRAGIPPRPEERIRGSVPPASLTVAVAGLGALGFGVQDDLRGSGKRRGLRGHLGALAHGEVTTGTVKLAGLTATGFAAALLDEAIAGTASGPRSLQGRAADVLVNAGLIAGGANLLNLFDLRPGRAIKVATLSAALVTAGSAVTRGDAPASGALARADAGPAERLAGLEAVAAPLGAALALLPEDLGERAMLGDAGANALGAMLGAAAARALPRGARIGLLSGIAALTLASEKVSFTKVIERTPVLRWLDMLGRRPVQFPAAPPSRDLLAPGASPGRRRPGRHRRAATGVRGSRSGAWLPGFHKTRPRPEP